VSQQIICDECGEPIDVAKPHYQLSGTKVQTVDGSPTALGDSVTLHYHEEHVPGYKIQGQEVELPVVNPLQS
jgi:hypothetical protein